MLSDWRLNAALVMLVRLSSHRPRLAGHGEVGHGCVESE